MFIFVLKKPLLLLLSQLKMSVLLVETMTGYSGFFKEQYFFSPNFSTCHVHVFLLKIDGKKVFYFYIFCLKTIERHILKMRG